VGGQVSGLARPPLWRARVPLVLRAPSASMAVATGLDALAASTATSKRDKVIARKRSDASRWAMLRDLCRADLPLIAASTFFMTAAAVAEASMPHFTSMALFAAASGSTGAAVNGPIKNLLFVGLAAAVFTGLRGCAFWIAGARVLRRLRTRLFAALLDKPAYFFDTQETAGLASRLSSDVGKISDVVSFNVNVIARQSIQALVALAWLLRIHARLSGVLVGGLVLSLIANQLYSEVNRDLSRRTQTEIAAASSVATEGFRLVRTIKVYATEARESARYDATCARIEALQDKQGKVYGSARVVNGALAILSTTVLIRLGASLCASGVLSPQQLTTFILSGATITSATIGIGEQWVKVQEALGAAEDILAMIEKPELKKSQNLNNFSPAVPQSGSTSGVLLPDSSPELLPDLPDSKSGSSSDDLLPDSTAIAEQLDATAGHAHSADTGIAHSAADTGVGAANTGRNAIELNRVNFAYPSREGTDVLRELSLRVKEGQLAAIVGASGSGKSTVLRLLCGLYEQDAGTVRVGGDELSTLQKSELARRVAWLPQEPQLFSGSIRDNIAYGLEKGSYTEAQLHEAARLANADGFIADLGGLDAPVGESGARLSGGQRQRVAVARALVRGAQLLLLDEPTSALDPASERLVQDVVLTLVPQRTVLIIAHRISTVERADVIFVMDAGSILESGTHTELLERNGAYARLVRASQRRVSLT